MVSYADELSDSEKFVIILQKYADEYHTQKELSEKMGIPKQSISDWKNNSRSIRIKNRNSISKTFRLKDMIWIDRFDDAVNFEEKLDSYRIEPKQSINQSSIFIANNIIFPSKTISLKEQNILKRISQKKEISLDDINFIEMSSASLYEVAKLLKSKNQIIEAVEVLREINEKRGSFKYTHHHQIKHLQAILYSHETLQQWDNSIDILRLLYVENYHIQEPEIITLLASNYKRKALYSSSSQQWLTPNEVDKELLSSALLLYREAYEAKKEHIRYYDAINFAYLYNIANAIEIEQSSVMELKKLYSELKQEWSVDKSNWWEVSSDAEFLMLIGEVALAKHNITIFLEDYVVDSFNIETTLRQLKLYLHFTQESNTQEFHDYLYESWSVINSD